MGLTYLDSSILIDAMISRGERGEAARRAIDELGAGERLVTSPLVDLECLVRPLRSGNQSRIKAVRETLARFGHLKITPKAYELATHVRAIHGLKTPDAVHIATASLGGCRALWTRDDRLLRTMPGFAVNPYADH